MKYIYNSILFLILLFSVSDTFALNITYLNPDITFLPATTSYNSVNWDERISWDSVSANQFCIELWGTFVSFNPTARIFDDALFYDTVNSYWTARLWYQAPSATQFYIADVVCDIPEVTGSAEDMTLSFYTFIMIIIWLFIVYQWQCFGYMVNNKMYNSLMKYIK